MKTNNDLKFNNGFNEQPAETQSSSFLSYFRKKSDELLKLIGNYYETREGRRVIDLCYGGKPNFLTYESFTKLPILDSGDLIDDPEKFLRGKLEDMHVETTGGSSGHPKKIYYSRDGMKSKLSDDLVRELQKSNKPTLIHGNWSATSYSVIEESMTAVCPKIIIEKYQNPSEILSKLESADLVYYTEQVVSFEGFIYYLESLLNAKDEKINSLKGKIFFIELVAEPVQIKDLEYWFYLLNKLTGNPPEILVIYGATEVLAVGFYHYRPGDQEIKYEVRPNKFVEVLNEDGDNCAAQEEGDVIITATKEDGSILPRYKVGDKGKISFGPKGEVYLSDLHRSPKSGMLSFAGYKIFVPEIYSLLKEKISFPIQIKCELVNLEGGKLNFNIHLYSTSFALGNNREEGGKIVKEIIEQEHPALLRMKNSNVLSINTFFNDTQPQDLIKGWQAVKK